MPAAPPVPAPEDPQQPQEEPSATSRLLKAQAAELAALRRRVADLPDPDELGQIREKAQRFDALSQRLPELQQRIAGAFQQQEAQVQQERLGRALQEAFTAAGGLPVWAGAFAELVSKTASFDANGNVVMAGPDGIAVPIAQALDHLRGDQMWSHTFRPSMGSGSGMAHPTRDVRTVHGPDLQRLNTRQKFDLAFGGGQQ